MMKDTFYFQHDYNARNDPKIIKLMRVHGLAGVGAYWCIVEQLYQNGGKLPMTLRTRTMKSHCSFDTCREILLANDLSAVNHIVLIHLSDGNSNAKEFKQGINAATGKTTHIAESGMTISNFNKSPF